MTSFISGQSFYGGHLHLTLLYYREIFNPPSAGKSLGTPLLLSDQLGFVVASCTGAFAVVMARRLVTKVGGLSQRITDIFLLGSIAIPGVVLAIGYIFFYNLSFITHHVINLYETLPLLIIALIASSLPGQTRFMAGPVSQIQPSLSEAARVHGAGRFTAWRTTNLPLMSRVLLWGWLLTFTKTISELAIATILFPPSQEPASVTIQNYLANFNTGAGTAMTVMTLIEMLGIIVIALGIYRLVTPRGWRRIGWRGIQS
jgi:iron(III) transport system permease protein